MSQEIYPHLPAIHSLSSRIEILENFSNETQHLVEHAQEGVAKCFECIEKLENIQAEPRLIKLEEEFVRNKEWIENIEEIACRADRREPQSGNHIRGIECECRLDNRAHQINTKAVLNDLWTRQKLLEEQVKILQETRTQLIAPMKKVTREEFKAQYPDVDDSHAKKQHCCPNCKGAGNILYFVETAKDNELYLPCVLCTGKGIVWG